MKVNKTIKLFINGEFPRTESGRSYPIYYHDQKEVYANLCKSSRKDFRNAVEAAKNAQKIWASKTSYNRGQILYRIAEMTQGKSTEFSEILIEVLGMNKDQATKIIQNTIDEIVHYAGFCDKFSQISGSINPVSGPYHNFTTPTPVGTTVLIDDDNFDFKKLMSDICSVIAGGNSLIVFLGKSCPAILAPLAEVFATSDVPKGVINLLTGDLSEVLEVIAGHRDVKAIQFQNQNLQNYHKLKTASIDNMKRVFPYSNHKNSFEKIIDTVEYKTVWHPIGV